MARITYLSKGVCMKSALRRILFMSAVAYAMSDADAAAPAAAPVAVAPTKESLVKRLESLIEADYDSVKTLAHDWLTDLEDFFGHNNIGATPAEAEAAPAATTGETPPPAA
jgi:hypothetical protein